jgi:hypothetical protein
MASFLESLWASIFTPGTTPTLLLATNVTFFSLQLLFFGLLVATYSMHFVALSILSAGLWWGINWFAAELQRAKEIEQEAERIRKRRAAEGKGGAGEETSGGEADEGEGSDGEEDGTGTETEREKTPAPATAQSAGGSAPYRVHVRGGPAKIQAVTESARRAQQAREEYAKEKAEGSTSGVKLRSDDSGDVTAKRRGLTESSSQADLSSSSMTDSEWEKVSEGER